MTHNLTPDDLEIIRQTGEEIERGEYVSAEELMRELTKELIDATPAGRETDQLVHVAIGKTATWIAKEEEILEKDESSHRSPVREVRSVLIDRAIRRWIHQGRSRHPAAGCVPGAVASGDGHEGEVMILEVTQKHIDAGTAMKSDRCPISLALMDSGITGFVGPTDVIISGEHVPLSRPAKNFINDFDAGLPVKPCRLRIPVPKPGRKP